MRRLGIMVLFDGEGVLDNYVKETLLLFKELVQKMIVVINGQMDSGFLTELRDFADMVLCRENIGFDAGAYKDVFIRFFPWKSYENFDEIVLMNDTFYAGLAPLKPLFDRFLNENNDFWGITRYPEDVTSDGEIVESHIQAYFLVVKKRLFLSIDFKKFWCELTYPLSYQRAVRNFEIRFTTYFEERGFKGVSWMDLHEELPWGENKGNPYMLHSYELIKDLHVPFLKKKCLGFENKGYINALKALEYIEEEGRFETRLIWENIFRLCRNKLFPSMLDYDRLEHFYSMHNRIYIYGAGVYGQKMEKYFQYRKWKFQCFLTSDIEDEEQNCRKYEEMIFEAGDGIILALGRAAFAEVYPAIREKMDTKQIFLLQYDKV